MPAAILLPFIGVAVSFGDDNIIQTLQQQALPDLVRDVTRSKDARTLRVMRTEGDADDMSAGPLLVQAYTQTDAEGVHCKIIESIGKLRDPRLKRWLIERTSETSIRIQCFAIWALGELHDPQTIAILRKKLWNSNRTIQMMAIDALGKTGRSLSVARELMVFLSDEDVQFRFLTAQSLRMVGGPEQVSGIADRLTQESSIEVQDLLAQALGQVGGQAGIDRLVYLVRESPSSATEHWMEVGLQASDPALVLPALTPLLEGQDFRLKLSAARILSNLPPHDTGLDRVRRWAQGSDLVVRAAAQRYLERVKAKP